MLSSHAKLYGQRRSPGPVLSFMMPEYHHVNRAKKAHGKEELCFHLYSGENHSSSPHKILPPSGLVGYFADDTGTAGHRSWGRRSTPRGAGGGVR